MSRKAITRNTILRNIVPGNEKLFSVPNTPKRLNRRSKNKYNRVGTKVFIPWIVFDGKGLYMAFYLEKETIPNKGVLHNDNE